MDTVPPSPAILIAETHIELFGHRFAHYPMFDELTNVFGHAYRTLKNPATLTWIWDDLGAVAGSWVGSLTDPAEEADKVRHVYFALRALGTSGGPLKAFPGQLTAFGYIWNAGEDPHSFVQILLADRYLEFKPNYDVPTTWCGVNHTSRLLRGGGTVVIYDPSADPSVSRDGMIEVAVRFNFPLRRATTVSANASVTKLKVLEIAADESIREGTRKFWQILWFLLALLGAALWYWFKS